MSDHGLHMHGLFYMLNIEQFWIEKELPILIINHPKKIWDITKNKEENRINMKRNT